jgi:hypothetical protein
VVKNVNKWLQMKSLGKFGKYFKSQWLDSRFNKWQLYHRTIGLAATNSPIESYNGRIKVDFTDRSYFNLVPAFEKLERLIEFESLKDQKFIKSPTVKNSDITKGKSLIKNSPKTITKINRNEYKVVGSKQDNLYEVDLIEKSCTCIKFFDTGSCKHLAACEILSGSISSNKMHIRYRRTKKVNKTYRFA